MQTTPVLSAATRRERGRERESGQEREREREQERERERETGDKAVETTLETAPCER